MNDNNRRVYSIPVTLYVECRLFILATSTDPRAHGWPRWSNLQDYFGFDTTHLTTDGENLLRIDDVVTIPIDISIVDLTQLTTQEYPPNTHPDFLNIPER